jgi:UDP-N-acetylmuramoyl-tripeptide--D-alanyl-D-alanine ligase
LTGRHQCRNAAAAAAVALSLGIAPEVIANGLSSTVLPGMRGKVVKLGNATIFNDSYNASPASMAAVLKMVSESVTESKIVLLLGTMLELGVNSKEEHRKTLALARRLFPDGVILTVGDGFSGLQESDRHYETSTDAADDISRLTLQQVTIIVKGSRGTALEKALPQEAR